MSIDARKKSGRGRPEVDSEEVRARMERGLLDKLDSWRAAQPEPRPSRQPFHELPNVVMTPHCSPWTEGTVERRSRDVARNIDRLARGEPLENVVAVT